MRTRLAAVLALAGLILATGLVGAVTAKETVAPSLSPNDHSHFGQTWNGSGAWGLLVQNAAAGGIGFYGNAYAGSGTTYGVVGRSLSPTGRGVYGFNPSTTGVTVGTQGVSSSSSGYGVFGDSYYRGVYGLSRAGGGSSVGTLGQSIATNGSGILGIANSGPSAFGVWGTSATGDGVVGSSSGTNGNGVRGSANNGPAAYGVWGTSTTGYGVVGSSTYRGVYGLSTSGGTGSIGTLGTSTATNGTGVQGIANSGVAAFGVWGVSSSGYAGYFNGAVRVNGDFAASGAKSFVIDHPLDPANKYLYHSTVESPDMKNMYDGVAALDARGEAWVELPAWFEAINKDFRYQLTSIGAPGPNLYVAQEIQGNRFKIAGGKPGMKVSWQVTGIRNDPYAQQNRMQVEVVKPDQERGKYLYPKGYGQPETKGVYYDRMQQAQSTAAGQKSDTAQQKIATVGKDVTAQDPNTLPSSEAPAAPSR